MPRLIWVFAGRTLTLLILSWDGSNVDAITCVQTLRASAIVTIVCLFVVRLNVPVNNFSFTASWVIYQYFRGVKCLAQGHNTAEVGFEPPTSRSGVQHSTTEPPRSPCSHCVKCELLIPYEPRREKMCLRESPTRQDTNWPAQLQRPARILKFGYIN